MLAVVAVQTSVTCTVAPVQTTVSGSSSGTVTGTVISSCAMGCTRTVACPVTSTGTVTVTVTVTSTSMSPVTGTRAASTIPCVGRACSMAALVSVAFTTFGRGMTTACRGSFTTEEASKQSAVFSILAVAAFGAAAFVSAAAAVFTAATGTAARLSAAAATFTAAVFAATAGAAAFAFALRGSLFSRCSSGCSLRCLCRRRFLASSPECCC